MSFAFAALKYLKNLLVFASQVLMLSRMALPWLPHKQINGFMGSGVRVRGYRCAHLRNLANSEGMGRSPSRTSLAGRGWLRDSPGEPSS